MSATLNTNKSVVIDPSNKWRKIDANTPRGAKLQLISKPAGVAQYGMLTGNNTFYTHWFPTPTFDKDET